VKINDDELQEEDREDFDEEKIRDHADIEDNKEERSSNQD
jgi:hypothetical protein